MATKLQVLLASAIGYMGISVLQKLLHHKERSSFAIKFTVCSAERRDCLIKCELRWASKSRAYRARIQTKRPSCHLHQRAASSLLRQM
jgi:hypothetical protein